MKTEVAGIKSLCFLAVITVLFPMYAWGFFHRQKPESDPNPGAAKPTKEIYYISNAAPAKFSEAEIRTILREKLSPQQMVVAEYPLHRTPEMDRWAVQKTSGATNDWERARKLFDALNHRFQGDGPIEERSAREVFAAWNTSEITLYCQDYAFLYVALARSVGLNAFFTFIEEDCFGNKTWHASAALFVGKEAILVDPSYDWFGVPHKKFKAFYDLQTTAFFLCFRPNLESLEASVKLSPKLLAVEQHYFSYLTMQNRWKEAREILPDIEKADQVGSVIRQAAAKVMLHDGKIAQAIQLLIKASEIDPSAGPIYINLGQAYTLEGEKAEAQASYEHALKCVLTSKQIEGIRAALTELKKNKP